MGRFKNFLQHHPMAPTMNRTIIISLFVILLSAWPAWGATYYIDPTCSSSGDGTTTTCGTHGPFKTWAEIASNNLWAAGNTYSQKGGTTAYETITVGAFGTAGNVITLNSYGTGKANLDGGAVVTSSSWSGPDGRGFYSTSIIGYPPYSPGLLTEDGVFLKYGSSSGNFYHDSTYSYYKPTSGVPSDHVIKKIRYYGINLQANSYITITGLNITNYSNAIYNPYLTTGQTSNYITVTGNDFSDCEFGVWLNFNAATSTGTKIISNTFDYIQSSIELQSQGDCGSIGTFDSVEISYNSITHAGKVRGTGDAYYWNGINPGYDLEGIGFQSLINSNVHHNTISGYVKGIVLFVCYACNAYNNNFYNNYIETDLSPLCFLPREAGGSGPANSFYANHAYYNILIGGGSDGHTSVIQAGNIPTPSTTPNTIYNNTIIAAKNGIWLTTNADYYIITNNIIYGTKYYHIVQYKNTSNIIYENNLYYPLTSPGYTESMMWLKTAGHGHSWANWKALGTNYDAHSPAPADPLFTNAVGGVYTLNPSSPAKWAGVNVGLTTDHAGKPVHNPPSIGAYEYGTSINPPTGFRITK